jgi:hypothetical protein
MCIPPPSDAAAVVQAREKLGRLASDNPDG